ncbi:MAG: adenine deaminase [Rhodobacteraceae bacterium]|nr:adenine deaminase [Paracoccaceae bacterium]
MEHINLMSWAKSAPSLIAVAAGREPADLVIQNCCWVNVHTREILPNSNFAIKNGRFAYCGPEISHCIGNNTKIVNGEGRFAVPGFCDAHMHIESGMLTPGQFAHAVMAHGTTSMFTDPHEIANVLGLEGVRLMHDEAIIQPINIFTQMPSCAPSAPGLETTGFEISPTDVEEAMKWPGIIGLGEMMNFPSIINGDEKLLSEIAITQNAKKIAGGHYASPDLGKNFHAYVASGVSDDHEGTCEKDALARARQGMRSMMRLGSAWYDVESQITAITEKKLDSRNFILCTDDCHSGTIVNEGHMNRVIRHAIKCGCEPVEAIQMATINTATHFGLERELGSISPGRRADIILTSDLKELPIESVFARGVQVAEKGSSIIDPVLLKWPNSVRNTVKLEKKLNAENFLIRAPKLKNTAKVKIIGVIENQAPTKLLKGVLPVENGFVKGDLDKDICQVALVERHRGTGQITNGFVSGFGYKEKCAVASTVAHDSHHMIIVGTDQENMALAGNHLASIGGGVTVFKDGVELATVSLNIAGLMSDAPAQNVAKAADNMVEAMQICGCKINNGYMQHSLLALVVIPELRISDLGLIDVKKFEITELLDKA